MPIWNSLGLQNGASAIMVEYILFYDYVTLFLVLILTFVGGLMVSVFMNKIIDRLLIEGQMVETIWTAVPGFILIGVALPSFSILYEADETLNFPINLKVSGGQWFWSYEYPDFKGVEFDSYPLSTKELDQSGFRLLDVDNRTPLPTNTPLKIMVTASDVLHSWTVPSLGIKVDAVPGRLNQLILNIQMPGLFFGQCSEICGVGHSFMPVALEAISPEYFIKWLKIWK